jgi:O-antigen/teichoic acid export membrane protein
VTAGAQKLLRLQALRSPRITHSVVALAIRVMAVGLGLILNVLIGRALGASGTGSYFVSLSVVTLIAVACRLGQDTLAVREIAAAIAHSRGPRSVAIFSATQRVSLISSLLAAACLWLLAPTLASLLFGEAALVLPLRIMSAMVPLMAVMFVASESLRGAGRVNASQFYQLVAAPLGSVVLIHLFPKPLELPAIAYAVSLGFAFAAVLALVHARRVFAPIDDRSPPEHVTVSECLVAGWPFCLAAITTFLNGWVDTLLLGALTDHASVGVYAVAARVSALCLAIKVSLSAIVGPKLAAAYALRDMARFEKEGVSFARIGAIIAIPAMLITLIFAENILGFFGAQFSQGALALRVLVTGQLVGYLLGFSGVALSMSDSARLQALAVFVGVVIAAALLIVLTASASIFGAAVAMAIGGLVTNSFSAICLYRRHGVRVDVFRRLSIVRNP